MNVKKFNISSWPSIYANYWGITKCGNTSVKYALLENEGKNIHKPIGISQWVHNENITKYISKEDALNNSYENFTVTRNPYDRVVSMYNDFIKRKDLYLIALGDSAKHIITLDNFLNYLNSISENDLNEHFKPQTFFIYEENSLLVDWVFDITEIPQINERYKINVPHINTTNNKIQINSNQIKIINKIYYKDFELLKYKKRVWE